MRVWGNIKFRTKIILVCVVILLLNSVITGGLYYNYAFKDTLTNYYESSEDMVSQMRHYLSNETQSITKRVHAIYNNLSFYSPMANFLRNPGNTNQGKLMGDVADVITELHQGDRYIQSVFFYTPYVSFDNFTRIRNHDFRFEESEMYQYFQEHPLETIRWFPAGSSQIFTGTDTVIPVVYRFKIERQYLYIVICLQQSEIQEYLNQSYSSYNEIFIADKEGNNILNYGIPETEVLNQFTAEELEAKSAICKEIQYEGETYLATCTLMPGTEWRICALRSAESLIGNLEELRTFVIIIICICALVSIVIIVVVAHSMTRPLGQLAVIMKRVTEEDFQVQFDYPYRDEVGHLGASFNFMIQKINKLVTELNIHIEALKEEKERVKQVEKQKRRAELQALQAQINPHFLYNTLNAITWQAADQGASEISIMSNSLGKFFRISLSKGREVITLREEMEHISSYLKIQKIRYKDKINYQMDVPEDVKELYIIKLVLQPLVENAIYHGIKVKEGAGMIRVKVARRMNSQNMQALMITIEDDGEGIEPEQLKTINLGLTKGEISRDSGYGIYNVNERLKLYYGEAYGLTIESVHKQWTKSVVMIPIRTTEGED